MLFSWHVGRQLYFTSDIYGAFYIVKATVSMRILWKYNCARIEYEVSRFFNGFVWFAGPAFIAIGLALIALVGYAFFTINLPYYFPKDAPESTTNTIARWSMVIWSCYLLYCIGFHYYMSVTTDPGTGAVSLESEPQPNHLPNQTPAEDEVTLLEIVTVPDRPQDTYATSRLTATTRDAPQGHTRVCKKCHLPKPDRTHHCSVCKRCILRMDHHCPWIHNCVGFNNHRYFYLFLVYLTIGCIYYFAISFTMFQVLVLQEAEFDWANSHARFVFVFSFLLAGGIGLAVGGMTVWQTYLIATAQTTIEYYGNSVEKTIAKRRGDVFFNEYDLGTSRNFKIFFNISGRRKWPSIFWPVPVPPMGDGKTYLTSNHLLSTTPRPHWMDPTDYTPLAIIG